MDVQRRDILIMTKRSKLQKLLDLLMKPVDLLAVFKALAFAPSSDVGSRYRFAYPEKVLTKRATSTAKILEFPAARARRLAVRAAGDPFL